MFLLLLSVLSVFTTGDTRSEQGEFDGLVNPIRQLVIESNSEIDATAIWNGKQLLAEDRDPSGITPDGVVWHDSVIGDETQSAHRLTLYFAGAVSAGRLELISSVHPVELSWQPTPEREPGSTHAIAAEFRLTAKSIQLLDEGR